MPLIYDGPDGRIYMGWLGGYSAEVPNKPGRHTLPPWLKSRTTLMFTQLKARGYDAGNNPRASAVLWGYVLDCMSYGQLGLDASAHLMSDEEVLFDMLEALEAAQR